MSAQIIPFIPVYWFVEGANGWRYINCKDINIVRQFLIRYGWNCGNGGWTRDGLSAGIFFDKDSKTWSASICKHDLPLDNENI